MPTRSLRQPLPDIMLDMLDCMNAALSHERQAQHDAQRIRKVLNQPDAIQPPAQKGWKDVKIIIDDDGPADVRDRHLMPCAYALVDVMSRIKMETFPFAVLPDVYDAQADARLEMAVLTDPMTGVSFRGRRWHRVADNNDYIAFDICSEGHKTPEELVGPWLTL